MPMQPNPIAETSRLSPRMRLSTVCSSRSSGHRQVNQVGQSGAVTVGGAESQLIALGPLQVKMRRVLPGHSDAAVQLNAFLGSVHGDAAAVGLCDGRGDRGVVVSASTGAGGV